MQKDWSTRIIWRYVLLQIPGLSILILILILLRRWSDFPVVFIWIMVCLWIAKDVVLFPLTWKAYDWGRSRDINPMLGKKGMAEERLNPCGYIKVQGELWEAELLGKDAIVEKGDTVTIEGIKGLTLLVKPHKDNSNKKS